MYKEVQIIGEEDKQLRDNVNELLTISRDYTDYASRRVDEIFERSNNDT